MAKDTGRYELRVSFAQATWEVIEAEARNEGVPVEDLIRFAVMYYIADSDSGRISRRVPWARLTESAGRDGELQSVRDGEPAEPVREGEQSRRAAGSRAPQG